LILQTRAAKIILLIIAFVLLGCAVFLMLTDPEIETATVTTSASESTVQTPPPPEQTNPATAHRETTETTPEITGISLAPGSQKVSTGQEINLAIQALVAGFGISGAELEVKFDPAVIQVISLSPGDLLGSSPIVAIEEINNSTGYVHYALARRGETQASDSAGTLVTLRCTIPNSAPIGNHDVTIKSAILTDEQFQETTSFSIQNGTVKIVQ